MSLDLEITRSELRPRRRARRRPHGHLLRAAVRGRARGPAAVRGDRPAAPEGDAAGFARAAAQVAARPRRDRAEAARARGAPCRLRRAAGALPRRRGGADRVDGGRSRARRGARLTSAPDGGLRRGGGHDARRRGVDAAGARGMKLTYANVTASAALFVALGGTSYAASTLARNSVGTAQIARGAVTSSDVRDRSLRARDFRAGTLPRGAQGERGPQGPPGAPAESTAVSSAARQASLLFLLLDLPNGGGGTLAGVPGGLTLEVSNCAHLNLVLRYTNRSGRRSAGCSRAPTTAV